MSTSTHTPEPWEYTHMADGRHHAIGILCTAFRGNEEAPYHPLIAQALCGLGHAPIDIAEANAAHIVRCVNSHAALVGALEDAMRYYIGERNSTNVAGETGKAADRIRAALAQARGE